MSILKPFKRRSKNPLKALADMYQKHVSDVDAKGYSKLWYDCATVWFNDLRSEELHAYGIEYLDGYFIFGTGTNSIVHFHIDECPGWKFGIWWSAPEDDRIKVAGQVFAQYGELEDKFKPSRSAMCEDIHVVFSEDGEPFGSFYHAIRAIQFIQHEPYLAFYRDYGCVNYNYEYHTREEAQQVYETWRLNHDKQELYTEQLNKRIWDAAQELFVPLFENAELIDRGDWISPRYELRAPVGPYKEDVCGSGFYSIADFSNTHQIAVDKFDAIKAECYSIADTEQVAWFCPLDPTILLT